jgi:Lipocalin-like domain
MNRLWFSALFICFLIAGCTNIGKSIPDERLVGEWATEKVMTQLGESQTYIRFKENGAFVLRHSLFQMTKTLSSEGTYSTDGNVLYLHGPNKSTKQSFQIENGILTIHEDSGDTFKYIKLTR